jgi:hypothetical protein
MISKRKNENTINRVIIRNTEKEEQAKFVAEYGERKKTGVKKNMCSSGQRHGCQ